jgi:tRNA-2-methylthio-N6-dimethylallyladenosine synthase
VFANSLRGDVIRTEDQMDLRNELAPQTILAKNPNKVDDLGVGQIAVV